MKINLKLAVVMLGFVAGSACAMEQKEKQLNELTQKKTKLIEQIQNKETTSKESLQKTIQTLNASKLARPCSGKLGAVASLLKKQGDLQTDADLQEQVTFGKTKSFNQLLLSAALLGGVFATGYVAQMDNVVGKFVRRFTKQIKTVFAAVAGSLCSQSVRHLLFAKQVNTGLADYNKINGELNAQKQEFQNVEQQLTTLKQELDASKETTVPTKDQDTKPTDTDSVDNE